VPVPTPYVLIGSPPPSLPQASVSPPLWNQRGEYNTRWRVRERGEPIQTTGEKAWHSVYSVSANHGTDTNPDQHLLLDPAQDSYQSVVRVSEDCIVHTSTSPMHQHKVHQRDAEAHAPEAKSKVPDWGIKSTLA
jgi:hypothetical protein